MDAIKDALHIGKHAGEGGVSAGGSSSTTATGGSSLTSGVNVDPQNIQTHEREPGFVRDTLHVGKHAGDGGVPAGGSSNTTTGSLTDGVNVDSQNIQTNEREPGFVRDTLHIGKHAGEGGVPAGGYTSTDGSQVAGAVAGISVSDQNTQTSQREPGFVRDTLHVGKHAGEGGVPAESTTTTESTSAGAVGYSEASQEQPKEHGILRQILNPGGEKYDPVAYEGAGAATGVSQTSEEPVKERGVLKQIFNPGNDKYDPDAFQGGSDVLAAPVTGSERVPGALATGSAAKPIESTEAAEDKHGVLRQLVSPGGEKYDEIRYEPTGNVVTDSSSAAATRESHVGRDAALGAGAGAVAYEAQRINRQDGNRSHATAHQSSPQTSTTTAPQQTSSTVPATTGSYSGLGGPSQTYGSSAAPSGNTGTTGSCGAAQTSPQTHRGAEAATLGAAGIGAAGLAAHDHQGHDTAPSTRDSQSYSTSGSYPPTQSTSTFIPSSNPSAVSGQSQTLSGPAPATNTSGPSLTAGTIYDKSQPTGASDATSRDSRGTEAAALGAGAGVLGGLAASRSDGQGTTSGLSQHVYNGVTGPVPATSKIQDHSAPRIISVSEGTGPASKPVQHPHGPHGPSYNVPSAYEDDHSAKVYNTVTGKHSVEDSELPNTGHESSHQRATDAGIGAGAGALTAAAIASGSHPRQTNTSRSTDTPSGIGAATGGASSLGSTTPAYQTSSAQAPGTQTGYQTSSSPMHHVGSSEAYGHPTSQAAGTAAAALAAQEAMRRHEAQQAAYPQASTIQHSGDDHHSTGPHKSKLLNKLDPRVHSGSSKAEHAEDSSHIGRDAGLGAGAGSAAGGALYEAEKYHGNEHPSSTPQQPHSQSTSATGPQSSTVTQESHDQSGIQHKTGLLAKLDPRNKSDDTQSREQYNATGQPDQSHVGRDAALGAGAGFATAGTIYEAEKHNGAQQTPNASQQTYSQPATTTEQHKSGGFLSKLTGHKSDKTPQEEERKHHGRDAAVVGGAGAATGGAIFEVEKHHGSQQPSSLAQESHDQTGTAGQKHKSGGFLSKLIGHTSDDASPQESHKHHGRDAAIAGGTGAATGGAVYEAERHHGGHQSSVTTQSSQPTTTQTTTTTSTTTTTTGPHKSSLLNKLDPRVKTDETGSPTGHEHHTGRDAALAGGAGAATGAGLYEAEKQHIGSSHTGYGTQQTSGQYEGYGDSEVSPHGNSGLLAKLDPRTSSAPSKQTEGSHTGRDVALAGGAGAATGAGIYEAEKHHHPGGATGSLYSAQQHPIRHAQYDGSQPASYQSSTQPVQSSHLGQNTALASGASAATTGSPYSALQHPVRHAQYDASQPASYQPTTQPIQSSHVARDTALAGGAGAATGAGIYEAEKHHGLSSTSAPQSSASGSGPASKTVGPHDSNIANILDPRVQPQPQYMKEHTTTGPYQSDTLNKLDPRVQHDPAHQSQTHEGRDLAAGAGSAAVAGAAIERHEHHDQHEVKRRSGILVHKDEHGHNKLHKEPREGFLHKLLHPHKNDTEGQLDSATGSEKRYHDAPTTAAVGTGAAVGSSEVAGQHHGYAQPQAGLPTEPHTGLPINVDKYGSGAGGTDASQTVGGYHAGSEVRPADWEDISKKNTPY